MPEDNMIVLETKALPETSTTLHLDIHDATRGIERKKELEGKITYNPDRCLIFFIPPSPISPEQPQLTPDRTRWDLYLVIIPYTLHRPPGERYYHEVSFFVEMSDPQITAFDMFPKTVTTKIETTQTITLSPQIKFQNTEISLGEVGRQMRFDILRPTIIASGVGEHVFYWTHSGFKEQKSVLPETKYALVVLQVPRGTPSVEATISYEVVIARKILDVWKYTDGETNPHPVRWTLQNAPSFFAPPAPLTTIQRSINSLSTNNAPARSISSPPSHPKHFDVCVVCALPEEIEAFLRLTTLHCTTHFEKTFDQATHSEYHHTIIQNDKGEPVSIHASWQPAYGPLEAGLHLKQVLDHYQPHLTAMTGICAGDKRKVKLGDLIVADRTFIYDNGKVILNKNHQPQYLPDPDIRHIDRDILQFVRMFDQWQSLLATLPRPISQHQQRDWLLNRLLDKTIPSIDAIPEQELLQHAPDWRTLLLKLQQDPAPLLTPDRKLSDPARVHALRYSPEGFPYQDPPQPHCFIAPMASGNAVRADAPFDHIQQVVRGTLAIDMEGAAFYRTIADFPGIQGLLVKSVCDYADSDKDDSYHSYAASASALYLLSFIKAYINTDHIPNL